MERFILALFAVFFVFQSINAQSVDEIWCATPDKNQIQLEKNPEAKIIREQLSEFTRKYSEDLTKSEEVYIIPIVFHIVHDYGAENISYDQILDAVDFVNKDFRKLRSDTTQIIDEFKSIAADSRIEFRLARLDPDGNCTKGVTRTASLTTHRGGNAAKEAAPSWPREMYLNVWVVHSLPRNAAGWAYYPGTAGQGLDGIIQLHSYTGSIGTSNFQRASTLTHEIGHYLNLMHPWGGSNTPGLASNCDIDDEVDDTPNTIGHTVCNVHAVTCGSLDNVQNYMEYSYCGRMFTEGQALRMRAALNHTASDRNNLWTEQNLWATGTHPEFVPELCKPLADFTAEQRFGCKGHSTTFIDMSHNAETIDELVWSFPQGEPSESTETNPEVVYNKAGRHNVELKAQNQKGNNSIIKEDFIHIYSLDDALQLPYTELFDSEAFPYIENSSNGFFFENFGMGNWHRNFQVAYKGNASLRINPGINSTGSINTVMFPIINLNSSENPLKVSFYAAFGRNGNESSDRLRFYISDNCGVSSRIVHVIDGNTLATANTSVHSNYMPMPNHWKKHSFIINPSSINCTNFRLLIESQAGGGNNLYIDKLTISEVTNINEIVKQESVSEASPNPFSDELYIDLQNYANKEVSIYFYNSSGKKFAETTTYEEVFNASEIFENKANGFYLIKISTDNTFETIRVVKQ